MLTTDEGPLESGILGEAATWLPRYRTGRRQGRMPRPTYDPDYDYALSDEGDHLRVRIRRDRKRVLDFVVQYEATVGERRRPVVRYDCAHGRCHRDVMDARGRKMSVSPFAAELDRKEALRRAREDILTNWQHYRAEFLETVRWPATKRQRQP